MRMFDRYFQAQFDQSMYKFETIRKSNNLSLSLFQDFSKAPMKADSQTLQQIVLETIAALQESKELIVELNLKDQILRNGSDK